MIIGCISIIANAALKTSLSEKNVGRVGFCAVPTAIIYLTILLTGNPVNPNNLHIITPKILSDPSVNSLSRNLVRTTRMCSQSSRASWCEALETLNLHLTSIVCCYFCSLGCQIVYQSWTVLPWGDLGRTNNCGTIESLKSSASNVSFRLRVP